MGECGGSVYSYNIDVSEGIRARCVGRDGWMKRGLSRTKLGVLCYIYHLR